MLLYTSPVSMFGAKARIALMEKGVAATIEHVPIDLFGPVRYAEVHPEVARINPKRQVPVLVDGDLELFDSTLIFEYLEDAFPQPPLWPQAPVDRARARLLELKADEVLFPKFAAVNLARRAKHDGELEKLRGDIRALYEELGHTLGDRDYVNGDTFSYADIAYYVAHFALGLAREARADGFPPVERWVERMERRASVAEVCAGIKDYLTANSKRPNP